MRKFLAGLLVVSGFGLGLFLRPLFTDGPAQASTHPVGPNATTQTVESASTLARLQAVEADNARLSALVQGLSNQPSHTERDAGLNPRQESPLPSIEDREKARTELFNHERSLLAAFEAEPMDAQWASNMRETLQSSLLSIFPDAGAVPKHAIDCRSSTCVARFSWNNYAAAITEYSSVDIPSTHCARFMVLPEPADKEAAYSANLILSCKR